MNEDYVAHCLELLDGLGPARARRLFGGHGITLDDLHIAIVSREGRLYLRVDAQTQPDFAAAGCSPFTFPRNGVLKSLPYWTAPEAALESPAQMRPWAQRAVAAALRARAVPSRRTRAASKPARGPAVRRRP